MEPTGNGSDFQKIDAAGTSTAAGAAEASVENTDTLSVKDYDIYGFINYLSPIKPGNISFVGSDFFDLSFRLELHVRRLDDECVPKGSQENSVNLSNVVNTDVISPVPADRENSSRLVNSISNYPGSDLIPTPCDGKNDLKHGGVTRAGSAERMKISSLGNYPVEPVSKEVYQQGHGINRRLLFANTEQNLTTDNFSIPYHPFNKNMNCSSSRANPADPKVVQSSNTAPATIYRRSPVFSTFSKPSGFGLHLNSIFGSMTPNSAATVGMKAADRDGYILQPNNNLFIPSSSEPEKIESRTQNIVNPAVSDHESSDQGKSPSELDMNQVNHQKKRKRHADENDGCKRCNCKKTQCLKLYCYCFAAGIYCSETCSCQDCFNKPEYERKVIEARQHIESRNPHAFAPKIVVKQNSKSPAVSNGEDSTPSSARHNRGCNCIKSQCLKKYCECYQANVGCSDGCRCEDCKNSFGKKEDYGLTGDVVAEGTINETSGSTQGQIIVYQNCNSYNSTSLVPAFLDSRNEFATAVPQSKEQFGSSQFTSSPFCRNEFATAVPQSMEQFGSSQFTSSPFCRNEFATAVPQSKEQFGSSQFTSSPFCRNEFATAVPQSMEQFGSSQFTSSPFCRNEFATAVPQSMEQFGSSQFTSSPFCRNEFATAVPQSKEQFGSSQFTSSPFCRNEFATAVPQSMEQFGSSQFTSSPFCRNEFATAVPQSMEQFGSSQFTSSPFCRNEFATAVPQSMEQFGSSQFTSSPFCRNEFVTAVPQSMEQFGSSQITSSPFIGYPNNQFTSSPFIGYPNNQFTSSPFIDYPNNLACPENRGFSSTGSTQWPCSSLARLTRFNTFNSVPDILKNNYNNNNNHHPLNKSPNKKRVFPPQMNHIGSSSLPPPDMRSSFNFILQVPSFSCNKPRDVDVTRK